MALNDCCCFFELRSEVFNLFKRKTISKDVLVGVCLGQDGIAVAQVRQKAGVPPSLEICDFQPATEHTKQSSQLQSLVKSHHLGQTPCVRVMEMKSYRLLQTEAPDVLDDELSAALRWRLKDIVSFEDAVIDVYDAPAEKAVGESKKVNVVIAMRELVRSRIDELLTAGLNLDVVDIPELALLNIATLLPDDVKGVVLLYIGRDAGIITISRRGVLYLTRNIQFGINSLPDTAVHADDPEAIHAWLDNIIIEIQRSLDYYESNYTQPRVAGLVVTPLDREIKGLTEYLQTQLGIPTRVLDVMDLIDAPEILDARMQFNCLLAIGAALRKEPEHETTD